MTLKYSIGSLVSLCFALWGCSSGDHATPNPPAIPIDVTTVFVKATYPRLKVFNASGVSAPLKFTMSFRDASAVIPDKVKDIVTAKFESGELSNMLDPLNTTQGEYKDYSTQYLLQDSFPSPIQVQGVDPLFKKNVSLPLQRDYLALLVGKQASSGSATSSFDVLFIPTEKDPFKALHITSPFRATTTLFRFVNTSPTATDVDLYILSPSDDITKAKPFMEHLQYKQFTYYFAFPSGLYRIFITPHGKSTPQTVVYKPYPPLTQDSISASQSALQFDGGRLLTCTFTGEEGNASAPLRFNILADTVITTP